MASDGARDVSAQDGRRPPRGRFNPYSIMATVYGGRSPSVLAPRWCKSLEVPSWPEPRVVKGRFFHKVFHNFCEDLGSRCGDVP